MDTSKEFLYLFKIIFALVLNKLVFVVIISLDIILLKTVIILCDIVDFLYNRLNIYLR